VAERKEIGKIRSVSFGLGGYQDAMIGITFDLGSDTGCWGVGDFWGEWAIKRSDCAEWKEEDRIRWLGTMVMRINSLLSDAKVTSIDGLTNIPIEVTFENNVLKSWRVLVEVI
jgi:hypothetical protein